MISDGYAGTRSSPAAPSSGENLAQSLEVLPHGEGIATNPSLQVTLAEPDQLPDAGLDAPGRPKTSPTRPPSAFKNAAKLVSKKRDSGIGTTTSATSNGSLAPDDDSHRGRSKVAASHGLSTLSPAVVSWKPDESSPQSAGPVHRSGKERQRSGPEPRISTDIPSASLFDDDLLGRMTFSKRGSILLGGRKANRGPQAHARQRSDLERPSLSVPPSADRERTLSADEELLSRQVRSLYEHPNGSDVAGQGVTQSIPAQPSPVQSERSDAAGQLSPHTLYPGRGHHPGDARLSSFSSDASGPVQANGVHPGIGTDEDDRGGLEDWEDLDAGDVDRYGFIISRKLSSRLSSTISNKSPRTFDPQRPQRVSTVLQLASESPRKDRTFGWKVGSPRTMRSMTPQSRSRQPSERSFGASSSLKSGRSSSAWSLPARPFRLAASRLHGGRSKRLLAEAGDMLTVPPGLADISENGSAAKDLPLLKEKESERADKWWKMARVVTRGVDGRGMVFDFDVRDPKLISRTWKGIPDRWRATAWHSFLSNSAKKYKDSPSDEEIIAKFHTLLEQSSADDVQIDLDVPRTISRHVLFRRRYRGGTGYVQGMASLAATLLCYYDEDTAFVMLVRMWQLRGLERLYQPGFNGLMEALGDFETDWLSRSPVASKLNDLDIDTTAYGTRWYLTLFNYSIPFPAQLRVWDVFMLLGDTPSTSAHPQTQSQPAPASSPLSPSSTSATAAPAAPSSIATTATATAPSPAADTLHGSLDILHATSAALIDGVADILLDSDFENAMKVLTSWIPIMDEELFMKVVKAEWKSRRRRS